MKAPDTRTFAQRWSDIVTEFSGSWTFIIVFAGGCAIWVGINQLGVSSFDVYPFLFLNIILTVISTFQSPLILMSQNRQNEVDRQHVQDLLTKMEELQKSIDRLGGSK